MAFCELSLRFETDTDTDTDTDTHSVRPVVLFFIFIFTSSWFSSTGSHMFTCNGPSGGPYNCSGTRVKSLHTYTSTLMSSRPRSGLSDEPHRGGVPLLPTTETSRGRSVGERERQLQPLGGS